ncbi:hypothetical protein PS2_000322 [Malus domestica]
MGPIRCLMVLNVILDRMGYECYESDMVMLPNLTRVTSQSAQGKVGTSWTLTLFSSLKSLWRLLAAASTCVERLGQQLGGPEADCSCYVRRGGEIAKETELVSGF